MVGRKYGELQEGDPSGTSLNEHRAVCSFRESSSATATITLTNPNNRSEREADTCGVNIGLGQ